MVGEGNWKFSAVATSLLKEPMAASSLLWSSVLLVLETKILRAEQ